jgi:hypothetical protein
MAILSMSGYVSFSIAARSPWSSSRTVLNGATFASSGFALTRAGTFSRAIHYLGIDRMLDPQRAVLIKRGNALLGRYELRTALSSRRLNEFKNGLFSRTVIPRGKRLLGTGCRNNSERDDCNIKES